MRAITVKQPWASLIVEGIKYIENRTWKCPEKYIGKRVLIHAGADRKLNLSALTRWQYEYACEKFSKRNATPLISADKYVRGAIIGSVEIVDCVVNHPSIWAEKTLYERREGTTDGCKRIEMFETLRDSSNLINPIWNWVLANPIKFFEPIPCKGKLSFWEYEGEI